MTAFHLKIIAMVSMFVDHIAYGLGMYAPIRNTIGRMAYPIYAFMIVESYLHLRDNPKRLRRYILTLMCLSIVSIWPYYMYFANYWNQILHLTLCAVTLMLVDFLINTDRKGILQRIGNWVSAFIVFIISFVFQEHFHVGYRGFGLCLIMAFGVYIHYSKRMSMGVRVIYCKQKS